jgi:hypothetical protein
VPRQNRRQDGEALRPIGSGSQQRVSWQGQDYLVRRVAGGSGSTISGSKTFSSKVSGSKMYRCPGCDQELPSDVAHVVAWPENGRGSEDRRHWHTPCWSARDTRRPTRR